MQTQTREDKVPDTITTKTNINTITITSTGMKIIKQKHLTPSNTNANTITITNNNTIPDGSVAPHHLLKLD